VHVQRDHEIHNAAAQCAAFEASLKQLEAKHAATEQQLQQCQHELNSTKSELTIVQHQLQLVDESVTICERWYCSCVNVDLMSCGAGLGYSSTATERKAAD